MKSFLVKTLLPRRANLTFASTCAAAISWRNELASTKDVLFLQGWSWNRRHYGQAGKYLTSSDGFIESPAAEFSRNSGFNYCGVQWAVPERLGYD